MPLKLSRLLFLIAMTSLSACSLSRHSETSRTQRKMPPVPKKKARLNSHLEFVDHIAISGEKEHSSHHRVKAYHSSRPMASPKDKKITSVWQIEFSDFLEVPPSEVAFNPDLWNFVDSWLGTPYSYGGESHQGIDCSAFVQKLYEKVFSLPSLPRTAHEQYKSTKRIKDTADLRMGDLVFFKIHSRRVSHVGVYLQNNKFVNASLSAGVTISDLTDRYWRRYYVGGGRPAELQNHDGIMLISSINP